MNHFFVFFRDLWTIFSGFLGIFEPFLGFLNLLVYLYVGLSSLSIINFNSFTPLQVLFDYSDPIESPIRVNESIMELMNSARNLVVDLPDLLNTNHSSIDFQVCFITHLIMY